MSAALPSFDDVVAQHLAIVGKAGSGKTFCAKGIVERLLAEKRRVCIVDPTGAWYGLRSSADGKSAGFPVVVFGGEHGDVPITEHSGERLAALVAERNMPCVVDLSEFMAGERHRFMTEFGAALHRKNRLPLHLVIDEADEFMPQNPLPESRRMLHEFDRIVRRGRIRGFRVTLITQRPAVIHKNVLTQANTLIAMRLPAPQDRKAIEEWVKGQADAGQAREVLESLSRLQRGEGWVWAPEHGVLERVQFPPITTFDSSRSPEEGDGPAEPITAAPVDIGNLRALLADASDPVEKPEVASEEAGLLRRRIRALEQEVAALQHGWDVEKMHNTRMAVKLLDIARIVSEEGAIVADGERQTEPVREGDGSIVPASPRREGHAPKPLNSRATGAPPVPEGERRGTGAELRILKVLAQRHPARLSDAQWATLAGMKRSGGTWSTYKSRLRTAELIGQDGAKLFGVTAAGLAAVGEMPSAPQSPGELIAMWRSAVGAGPGKMLDALISAYPHPMDRANLADRVRMTASGGTFSTYLSRLKSNGLVEVAGRRIKVSPTLMEGAR